ncbi:hypothetical protein P389DRAFT_211569 [Cystobasidium minutum MCA 4210]|uniref:uncharacterized protein n=1 Tax=Cystobasidium minutum MCA 4210 TaxID=1397322 RepID=UPI0034CEEC39|eukprot:jgi/Rhomi1/211569/estExt_Genemark1.C_5_t10095
MPPASDRPSRSPSTDVSAEDFNYEVSAQDKAAATSESTVSSPHTVTSGNAPSSSQDDVWASWKPQITAEKEAAAAYQNRSLRGIPQVSPSADTSSIPSSLCFPTSPSPPAKPSFPHLPISSRKQTSSTPALASPLESNPSSSPSQMQSAASAIDSWGAWNPGAEACTGEEAFRNRQYLSRGNTSVNKLKTQSLPLSVLSEEQATTSHRYAPKNEVVVEMPLTLTTSTDSKQETRQSSQDQKVAQLEDDPWSAWSATPAKDLGGADAFRRRQAMGLGERVPVTASTATSKSNPSTPPPSTPKPKANPKKAAKPPTPKKASAANNLPVSNPPNPATKSNQGAPSGAAAPSRGGKGRGAAIAVSPAAHTRGAPSKGAALSIQKQVSPLAKSAAHPASPQHRQELVPSPTNIDPSTAHVTSQLKTLTPPSKSTALQASIEEPRSPVQQAELALRAVSHAYILEKVPEESLIDLVGGPAPNVLDTQDEEQLGLRVEVLTQLQGLSFELSPDTSAGPSPDESQLKLVDPFHDRPISISASLDSIPPLRPNPTSPNDVGKVIHDFPSVCSTKTFHSAAEDVPCLIHDTDEQSDGASPVTPMQPLRALNLPTGGASPAIRSPSVGSYGSRANAEEDRAARLSSAVATLGYAGTTLCRISFLVQSLPNRDQAMCLFNEAFLRKKVAEAMEVIALEDEESDGQL